MTKSKINQITENSSIDLSLDTIKMGKQALIFVNSKRGAEKTAEDISKKIKDVNGKKELDEISEKIINILSKPTKQCERLSFCVKKGIAFHHAGLASEQKAIIEENFKKGVIKIICSTPTLAAGVDLPAFRTIIKDLKRFGDEDGMGWIPVLEYIQMAGRAGRPKYDSYGEAIILSGSKNEKEALYDHYILGEPEDIFSKLAVEPGLRTYILSLIASEFVADRKQLMDFFEKTFWAFQFRDTKRLEHIMLRMLSLLEEFEFIKIERKMFSSANEKEHNERVSATLMGKRVAELYIDPLTAHHMINCSRRAAGMHSNHLSFLQMISHTLEMRPLLRVRTAEYDEVQQWLNKNYENIIDDEPQIYDIEHDEFLSSVKLTMMFDDWVEEYDEEYLLEKYNVRPGELRVKLERADWLLYASEEIVRILNFKNVMKEISKLRFRLKYGVKEELLPLLQLEQIGRVRARRLYNNKIKDIGDVKKADISLLSQLVGKSIAVSIKEQVGEKFDEKKLKKDLKKEGQQSLGDF